jgi:hypothetical protein
MFSKRSKVSDFRANGVGLVWDGAGDEKKNFQLVVMTVEFELLRSGFGGREGRIIKSALHCVFESRVGQIRRSFNQTFYQSRLLHEILGYN